MTERNRRVILNTADLDDGQRAQLAERFAAAIEWQQALAARSPHVLQFISGVQEVEGVFFVEHEAAKPYFDISTMFDGLPPELDITVLMQLTCALIDALKAAHSAGKSGFGAHGGVCPGVVLRSEDGIEKVTDFGFASVICSVLGPEAYLNLAVGHQNSLAKQYDASGAWEILSPDEFEREDRICAFVDPEKFGTAVHESFEPGSDVICAAFVLHLMAEHRHPYLLEAEAHKFVEISELMSAVRYNGARRKELRESNDPAVKTWCSMVESMLARVPGNRPATDDLMARLSPHVQPVDAGELLRRRVDSAQGLADAGEWDRLRAAVTGIADASDVPEEVAEKARGYLRLADAHVALGTLRSQVESGQWDAARSAMESFSDASSLPEDMAAEYRSLSGTVNAVSRAKAEIEGHRHDLEALGDSDPSELAVRVAKAIEDTSRQQGDASLPDSYRQPLESILQEFQASLQTANAAMEARAAKQREEQERRELELQAAREQAAAWLESLEEALTAKDFDELGARLGARPELSFWPDEIIARSEQINGLLQEEIARQQRLAAEKSDREAAEYWLAELQELVEASDWTAVTQKFQDKPQVRYFPADVETQAASLAARAASELKRESDERQALEYITELDSLIESEQWRAAGDRLSNRPRLEHWPDQVLEREAKIKGIIEENLEAIELQRRQIAAWIESADAALSAGNWQEVIARVADDPVPRDQLNEEDRQRLEGIESAAREGLERELEARQGEARASVKHAAVQLVHSAVEDSLADFLEPKALSIEVSAIEFADPAEPTDGSATMAVRFEPKADRVLQAGPVEFNFRPASNGAMAIDDPRTRQQITDALRQLVGETQTQSFKAMESLIRSGPFPEARLDAELSLPARELELGITLCPKSSKKPIAGKLVWNSSSFAFGLSNLSAVKDAMSGAAADSLRDRLPQAILSADPELQRHKDLLAIRVEPGKMPGEKKLPASVPIEIQVSARPGKKSEEVSIGTLSVSCSKIGELPADLDPGAVTTAFRKFLLAAQDVALGELASDLTHKAREIDPKCSVWTTPAKIQQPADSIELYVGRKKRKARKGAAAWDSGEFCYVAKAGWEPEPPPPKPEGGRKGVMVIGGVAGVAVIAVVAWIAMSGPKNGPPPPTPRPTNRAPVANAGSDQPVKEGVLVTLDGSRSSDPDGDDLSFAWTQTDGESVDLSDQGVMNPTFVAPPVPDGDSVELTFRLVADDGELEASDSVTVSVRAEEPLPPDEIDTGPVRTLAVQILRDESNGLLGPFSDQLVTLSGNDNPVLTCRVPGHIPAEFVYALPVTNNQASLPAENESELRAAVTALGGWLNMGGEAFDVQGSKYVALSAGTAELVTAIGESLGPFVDGSRLTVTRTDSERPQWRLSESADGWQATGVTLQVWNDTRTQMLLSNLDSNWTVANGNLRLEELAPGSTLESMLTAVLLQEQAESANVVSQQITGRLGDSGQAILATPVDNQLLPALRWDVSADGLLPRALVADWNNRSLGFKVSTGGATSWEDVVDAIKLASATLDSLNQRDNWITEVSAVPVREVEPLVPGGRWLLSAVAPWADPPDDGQLDQDDELPIVIPAGLLASNDAQSWVDAISSAEPAYWQAIRAYTEFAAMESPMMNEPYRSTFTAALNLPPGGLQYLSPKMERSGASAIRVADQVEPSGVEVSLVTKWDVGQAPSGIDGSKLGEYLNGALGNAVPVTIAMNVDAGGRFSTSWQGLDGLNTDLAQIAALDQLLGTVEERMQVETTLDAKFPGFDDRVSVAPRDALTLLQRIWAVKGVPAPRGGDFATVASNIANLHGFDNKQFFATVFVEYFCGPKTTFAVFWSVDPVTQQLSEGPELRRPLATSAVAKGSDSDPTTAPVLINSVLEFVPNAVKAGNNFDNSFGVVLALDEPMQWVDLANAQLGQDKTSTLKAVGNPMINAIPVPWSSLQALRRTDRLGDFQLVRSLPQARPWNVARSVPVRWAHFALEYGLPLD